MCAMQVQFLGERKFNMKPLFKATMNEMWWIAGLCVRLAREPTAREGGILGLGGGCWGWASRAKSSSV